MPDGGFALAADVSSEAEVLAAFAALDAAGEVPDIVVHCAGIIIERPLTRMTLEEFELIMRVNLRGCFLVGREAVIRMRGAGRGGRGINIASELAHLEGIWLSSLAVHSKRSTPRQIFGPRFRLRRSNQAMVVQCDATDRCASTESISGQAIASPPRRQYRNARCSRQMADTVPAVRAPFA